MQNICSYLQGMMSGGRHFGGSFILVKVEVLFKALVRAFVARQLIELQKVCIRLT